MSASDLSGAPQESTRPAPSVDARASSFRQNSFANLVRAATGSLENLLLPFILLVMIPRTEFAAWALMFSISAYLLYLDLGLQAAAQASVARVRGSSAAALAADVGRAAFQLIGIVIAFALCAICAFAAVLPSVFPDIPQSLAAESAIALVVLAIGQGANLAINVGSGYYAGLNRSPFPAYVMAIARLVSLLSVLAVATQSTSLPVLAFGYSVPLVLGMSFILTSFVRESTALQHGRPRKKGSGHRSRFGLLRYSGPLVVWNVCALLVSAAGTAIVGRVDFDNVPLFSVAIMFSLAINGIDNALLAPLLSRFGARMDGESVQVLQRQVNIASRLNTVLLVALLIAAITVAWFLQVLGYAPDFEGAGLATVLLISVGVGFRLSMTPTSMAFIATGVHSRILLPPVIEAVASVLFGVAGGVLFGAPGVAGGIFVASLGGVAMTGLWSRRTAGHASAGSTIRFLRAAVLPFTLVIPVVAAALSLGWLGVPVPGQLGIGVVIAAALVLALWFMVPRPVRATLQLSSTNRKSRTDNE